MSEKIFKVAYNYIDDLLERARQVLDTLSQQKPFNKAAYTDVESRYRVLLQKRNAPYAESNNLAAQLNSAISKAKLQDVNTQQGMQDTSDMVGFHNWENDTSGGMQSIDKIPNDDPSQPEWVRLPKLKLLGTRGDNPAQSAKYIKDQMGEAVVVKSVGSPKDFKPTFDTYVRGTAEAWGKFVALSPNIFDTWNKLPDAKKLGLKSEKSYNPEYQEASSENKYNLSVEVINPEHKDPETGKTIKDREDVWDIGPASGKKSFKQGLRLRFEPQDPNFYAVGNLVKNDLGLDSTRVNRSERTIDIYDIHAKSLNSLSLKLKSVPFRYSTQALNDAINTLTGRSVAKIQQEVSRTTKAEPLSQDVVANRIQANLYTPEIQREAFDAEVTQLYPGAFNPKYVNAQTQAAQRDGMFFILGRGSSILADEPGSGKCQVGSTLVNINDKTITLADAWDHYVSKNVPSTDGIGEFGELKENLFVHSIDSNGKVVKASVTHIFRQNFNGLMKKYTTSNGKNIQSTFSHKFLTTSGWQNALMVSDKICSPIIQKQLLEPKKCDIELAEFLAWQISEGCEYKEGYRLTITQKDSSILERLKQIFDDFGFDSIRGTPVCSTIATNNKGCTYLRIASKDFITHLEKLGYEYGHRSAKKQIPDFIMQSHEDVVKVFLRAIFDAEGYASKTQRRIGFTSASRKLIMQISALLSRFGILHTFHNKIKCATNTVKKTKRAYYELTIIGTGIDVFMSEIGFGYSYKNDAVLSQTTDRNTNKEGKPVEHILNPLIEKYAIPYRHLGISNQKYLDGSRGANNEKIDEIISCLERISSGEQLRIYKEKTGNKWTASTIAVYESIDLQDIRSAIEQLHILRNNDLIYETVVSVEEVPYDGYIYDLTVDKYHNYVAEGLICHNTAQSIVGADFATVLQDRQAAKTAQESGQPVPAPKKILVFTPLPLVGEHWTPTSGKQSKPEMFCGHNPNSICQIRKLEDYDNITPETRWVVIPYTTMDQSYGLKLAARIAADSAKGVYGATILDEIQTIKNLKGSRGSALQSAISGSGNIKHRIGLTGTPADNDPTDLHKQLRVTRNPLIYDTKGNIQQNEKGFAEQFLGGSVISDKDIIQRKKELNPNGTPRYTRVLEGRIDGIISWGQRVNKQMLIDVFTSTFIRRTKEDMKPDMIKKHRDARIGPDGQSVGGPTIIDGEEERWNTRLKELQSEYNPDEDRDDRNNPWQKLEKEMALAKVPHTVNSAVNHLINDPDAKLFVVTKYPDIASQIANSINEFIKRSHPELSPDGTIAADVSGDTDEDEKMTTPDAFKQKGGRLSFEEKDSSGKVIKERDANGKLVPKMRQAAGPLRCVVYTMKVGSVGLNFGMANKAIFNDIDWNPSTNLQAEDRVHRLDSTQPEVDIEYVFFNGTYDEEMFNRVRQKEAVNNKINAVLREAHSENADTEKVANEFIMSLVDSLLFQNHMSEAESVYANRRKKELREFLYAGTAKPSNQLELAAYRRNGYKKNVFSLTVNI